MQQHLAGYIKGHRTIWKVKKSEDAYELMSSYCIRNYIKYFKDLAEINKVWASTTIDKIAAENLLMPKQEFSLEWREFLKDEFLPNIGVWALRINPYDAKKAVLIESAIQKRLVKVFELGGFFNKKDLSILGKIEFYGGLVRIREEMLNTPDLDEASRLVIESLGHKKIPETAFCIGRDQLSSVISFRSKKNEARRKAREVRLDKYPKHGSPWSSADLEKLRVMLVDFELSPKEMSVYLERESKAISLKIDQNDRRTNLDWRSDINALY